METVKLKIGQSYNLTKALGMPVDALLYTGSLSGGVISLWYTFFGGSGASSLNFFVSLNQVITLKNTKAEIKVTGVSNSGDEIKLAIQR